MRLASLLALSLAAFRPSQAETGHLDVPALEQRFASLTRNFDGRVGVCVQSANNAACARPDERFSLQSVMKLVVGFAVLDAVDNRGWMLAQQITIRREDLSLNVQPLAKLVGSSGFRTSLGDLVRRAIIDSDSAAVDVLLARLGGPVAVNATLNRKGVFGIRLDRDERHLQTETVGLAWKPEYVDAHVLESAVAGVPPSRRDQAYAAYQVDRRDTATPRAMTVFLFRLAKGDLLSKPSTAFVLQAMKECNTFPDRLKAGVPQGWQVAHKTGTSGSWKGLTVATNDVGIITAPNGSQISISVFVANSHASSTARAALIAQIASSATAEFRRNLTGRSPSLNN